MSNNTIEAYGDVNIMNGLINGTIEGEFIDDRLEDIKDYAFRGCTKLTAVSLPFVRTISNYAFAGCASLSSVSMPKLTGFGTYDGYMFQNCTSLTDVDFPMLEKLPSSMFDGCTNLVSVNAPKAKSIEKYVFAGCNNVKEVNAPLVTTITANAFQNVCDMLEVANFPNCTTINGSSAFEGKTKLTAADFRSLKTVTDYTFRNCTALESVNIDAAQIVNQYAFYGCTSLKQIRIPYHAVTQIRPYAFGNCSNLVALVFSHYLCANLNDVSALSGTPIASGTGYIYVPAALVDTYKAATNWSTYADQFRALEDYTVDGTTTGELDETKIAA